MYILHTNLFFVIDFAMRDCEVPGFARLFYFLIFFAVCRKVTAAASFRRFPLPLESSLKKWRSDSRSQSDTPVAVVEHRVVLGTSFISVDILIFYFNVLRILIKLN
jgi:hypothetical protein